MAKPQGKAAAKPGEEWDMLLANFLFLLSYSVLIICLYILYSDRQANHRNWTMVLLGLCSVLWAGGVGGLYAAPTANAKLISAYAVEIGVHLGLVFFVNHLGRTLCGNPPFIQKLFPIHLGGALAVLAVVFVTGPFAVQWVDGAVTYTVTRNAGYYISLGYEVLSFILAEVLLLYADRTSDYRRVRLQAAAMSLCLNIGLIAVLLASSTSSTLASMLGGVVQAACFLMLYFFCLRYPHVFTNATLTPYIHSTLRTPFVTLDTDGVVQFVNNSGATLLGADSRDLVGKKIYDCMRFLDEYRPIQLARAGNAVTKYEAVTHSGNLCELEVNYVYDQFDEIICVILLINDVTVHMRMIQQLEDNQRKAEQANTAKSIFLANTSHEIRTPMNAIVGFTELLSAEVLRPNAAEYVQGIRQASDNLLSIINDVLDFSKIESGTVHIAEGEYQLESLLNDVSRIISMRLADSQLLFASYVDCHLPSKMLGDEARLRQILLNLLNNAVKYTDEGHILFLVRQQYRDEEIVVLAVDVVDTGIGIREEDMPKLFDDFVRVDMDRNQAIEGTGLGLAISKRLCIAAGGDIEVTSEYGVGSTFTMTIPQKIMDATPIAQVDNPQDKKVLLLENRGIYAQTISKTVQQLGVACTCVPTQSLFFRTLRGEDFDYIFVQAAQYNNAKRIVERVGSEARLVLLTEFGDISSPEERTLSLPATAMSVADVLNSGKASRAAFNRNDPFAHISFTAPTARVMVVDDLYTNLKVTQGLLAPFKMEVDMCQSGEDAVNMVLAWEYDIIFMDHMMPGMDGVEATKIIRQQGEHNAKVPIIALTANAVSGMREMFLKNGMDDFLPKPVDMAMLSTMVERWLPEEKKQKREYLPAVVPAPEKQAELKIKGLDTRHGLQMAGESKAHYIETLRVFTKEVPGKIQKIRDSAQNGDYHHYAIEAHALKSALASIGAWDLSEHAKQMEQAGHQNETAYILADTETFLQHLDGLRESILAALPQENQPDKATFTKEDMADLPAQVDELREALALMDAADVEEKIARLRQTAWPDPIESALQAVNDRIDVFDYAEAARLLETVC